MYRYNDVIRKKLMIKEGMNMKRKNLRGIRITDRTGHVLGVLTRKAGGKLDLEVADKGFESDLRDFLQRISSKPLPLRYGERQEEGGVITFVDKVRYVTPQEDGFLGAVRDLLLRTRFGSTPLRGWYVMEERADEN
jgi:hypothetical protein